MTTKKPSMNIITVIPISRAKGLDELSYFTAAEVPVGAIVSVPIRSKNVSALVISSRPAVDIKAEIRKAPYPLKKLGRIKAGRFLPASFVRSCAALAEYYAASAGAIMDALISDGILSNLGKLKGMTFPQETVDPVVSPSHVYAVQGDDDDRLSSWRSLIRQEFARKRSIVVYVPTVEDVRRMSAALTKGIEGYMFSLNGSMTKKQILETWNRLAEEPHPVVVVATGSFSVLPRQDIRALIIERENSRGWTGLKHPFVDARHALERIALESGMTVYRSDIFLRTETLSRANDHDISVGSPFKWRSLSSASDMLVDMKHGAPSRIDGADPERASTEASSETLPFRVLSPELEGLIRRNQEESTNLFILAIRRGHSPITVCGDCETVVRCHTCAKPVTLHASDANKRFFMCHSCGERRSADETCATCAGWRLTPLGIGIERVAELIGERFPGMDVFRLDADSGSGERATDIVERFRSKPGSVLLGTEMALPHLPDKLDHIAVASLDSLFALPDFRISEKAMHMLVRLRAAARTTFLVQTRMASEPVFAYALKGNLADFHRTTLEDRKRFSYPPFSTLIKITIEGSKDAIAARMAEVRDMLAPRELDIFPAFTTGSQGRSVIHGLLTLPQGSWPHSEIVKVLRSLPPDVKVKVDPESLL